MFVSDFSFFDLKVVGQDYLSTLVHYLNNTTDLKLARFTLSKISPLIKNKPLQGVGFGNYILALPDSRHKCPEKGVLLFAQEEFYVTLERWDPVWISPVHFP